MKIRYGKIILSAFIFLIISFILRQIEVLLTMKYYVNPEFFGVWSKLMMPTAGPPPPMFYIISLIVTLASGIILVFFYELVKDKFGNGVRRTVNFTVFFELIIITVGYLPMYMLINVPTGIFGYWIATDLISIFVASLIFAKILK